MIEQVPFKNDFRPQGLIKVELFEDNKKIEEIKTHNFISKGVREPYFKAKMKETFTKGRATGGITLSEAFLDPYKQISLTNADHAEEPEKEWLRKGDLIGYAISTSTYSGADTQRGSYNQKESFTNDKQVRMVFDFPTNAANGVFKSIYFHPDNYSLIETPMYESKELMGAYSIKKYFNKYYILKSKLLEMYSTDWVLLESFNLPNVFKDFEIVDDIIYYAFDSSTQSISKANVNKPNEVTLVYAKTAYYGICYIKEKNQFVVSRFTNLDYFDTSFNLVNSIEIKQLTGYPPLTYLDGELFAGNAKLIGNKYDYQLINNKYIIGAYDDKIVTPGYILDKFYIGSRSLLPNPIEKKENQTMKITYDFMLE